MPPKFLMGSGPQAAQPTGLKSRFDEVGHIHGRAGRRAGTGDHMYFIDEQNWLFFLFQGIQ